MKKDLVRNTRTPASVRSSAMKKFLTTQTSYLTLQPIHVLILSLCFIANILLLHIIGRFGSSISIQTIITGIALLVAAILAYVTTK
ncbi:protein transport protein SEC61 subunit beta [Nematocida sp. AWRm80]|nr:protein transport protein SEC61 subunit beta [Nematocida sp. AWRm80]